MYKVCIPIKEYIEGVDQKEKKNCNKMYSALNNTKKHKSNRNYYIVARKLFRNKCCFVWYRGRKLLFLFFTHNTPQKIKAEVVYYYWFWIVI